MISTIMSASNSSGIQTLLDAENKAQEIVQEARAYRSQRIKASKTDAAAEIDEYKKKKEEEFNNSTSQFEVNEKEAESATSDAAQDEIEAQKKRADQGRKSVLDFLVKHCISTN